MDHRLIAKEWSRLLDEFFATRGDAYRRAVDACVGALKTGRKILAFGNGGSAAEAQHFVAELVNKFLKPRPALRAVTLSTDTSVLTCIGNDISYDAVFSRQVEALGDLGDIALALTTSGNSPNVIEALKTSKEQGLVTIVLAGWSGGKERASGRHPPRRPLIGNPADSGNPPLPSPSPGRGYRRADVSGEMTPNNT